MVRAVDDVERRIRSEFPNHRFEEAEIGEIIASPLKKEHGDADPREMLRSLHVRPFGRVKRKSQKEQSSNAVERFIRGR